MDRINNHHISTQSEIHTQSPVKLNLLLITEYRAASDSLSDTSDFVAQESYKHKKHFQSDYQLPNIPTTKILSNAWNIDISTESNYDKLQEVDYIDMFVTPIPVFNISIVLQSITQTFA